MSDVTVHIDPEDDQMAPTCTNLPLRNQILQRLQARWKGIDHADKIDKVVLHYLSGMVDVDVFLPMAGIGPVSTRRVSEANILAAQGAEDIRKVRVYYC